MTWREAGISYHDLLAMTTREVHMVVEALNESDTPDSGLTEWQV